MQERKQNEGLKLFSNQFRKQHSAVRAAFPSFKPKVFALRHGPSTGAGQEESQLQEQASKLEAGSAGRQAKSKFEASFKPVQKATFGSMGCLLRARSVLQGQGVLALRHGPSTGAGQEESQLQEQASKLEAGSA